MAELPQLLGEIVDLVADLEDLLALQRKDLLLLRERQTDDIFPLSRRLLNLCLPFRRDLVLLQQLAEVPDGIEDSLDGVCGELHIADVRHRGVEQLRVLRVVHRRVAAEALEFSVDEVHHSLDPLLGVALQKTQVLLLPLACEGHQLDFDRLRVEAEPMNVHWRFHVGKVVLHVGEKCDFLVELVQARNGPPDVHLDPLHNLLEGHAILLEAFDDVVRIGVEESLECIVDGFHPEELVLCERRPVLHTLLLGVIQ
mmetsp:Transcript_89945/g.259316  ORF Transcript_89945/g.259316 Transcript_89945/m.259316 type:complete len:255 (+) Transcript_89945:2258-3022(+)